MQTEFEITFFVDRLDSDTDAQNELFDLISRHAVAAGARLAPPKNAAYQPRDDAALDIKDLSPDTVLTLAGIFVSLTPDERAAIAAKLKKASYEKGDVLVKPDDLLQSLFIVGSGVLSVTRPGQYCGERMAAVWTRGLLWGDGTSSRQTRYRKYHCRCALHRVWTHESGP